MLEHKGTKTIKTPRLTLRRFELEDARAMYDNWAGDEEVVRFLTWPAHGCAEISRLVLEDWVDGYEKDDFTSFKGTFFVHLKTVKNSPENRTILPSKNAFIS